MLIVFPLIPCFAYRNRLHGLAGLFVIFQVSSNQVSWFLKSTTAHFAEYDVCCYFDRQIVQCPLAPTLH